MNEETTAIQTTEAEIEPKQTIKRVVKKRGPKPKAQKQIASREESAAARSETRQPEGRRRRLESIGKSASKLAVPDIEGYTLRWVNDKDNRLTELYQQDWNYVEKDEIQKVGESSEDRNSDLGNRVTQVVGVKEDGSPLRAFLMKKRVDWHEQDRAIKQKQVDEIDQTIKNGGIGREQEGSDHQYMPNGQITYETGARKR
jgi:hypothetical protein